MLTKPLRRHHFRCALAPHLGLSAFSLLIVALLLITLAGCRNQRPGVPGPESMEPADIAAYVSGTWTATLNATAVEQGAQPLNVPLSLDVQGLEDGDGTVSGSIAGVEFTDGGLSMSGELPTLRFTTGDILVQGAVQDLRVQGPLDWTAVLEQGTFRGSVVGADGRDSRWRATPN